MNKLDSSRDFAHSLCPYMNSLLASPFLMPNNRVQHVSKYQIINYVSTSTTASAALAVASSPFDPNRQRQDLSKICIYNSGHIADRGHVFVPSIKH